MSGFHRTTATARGRCPREAVRPSDEVPTRSVFLYCKRASRRAVLPPPLRRAVLPPPKGRPPAPKGRPPAPKGRPPAPKGRPPAPKGRPPAPKGRIRTPPPKGRTPLRAPGRTTDGRTQACMAAATVRSSLEGPSSPSEGPSSPLRRAVLPLRRAVLPAPKGRPPPPKGRPPPPKGRPPAPKGRPHSKCLILRGARAASPHCCSSRASSCCNSSYDPGEQRAEGSR
jgi:hypothetical protein